MWHEARRSERKVHDMMDAARKRAQRRAIYLAKRRGDPQQSIQAVGSRCRIYREDALYQATEDQQGLYDFPSIIIICFTSNVNSRFIDVSPCNGLGSWNYGVFITYIYCSSMNLFTKMDSCDVICLCMCSFCCSVSQWESSYRLRLFTSQLCWYTIARLHMTWILLVLDLVFTLSSYFRLLEGWIYYLS